MAVEGFLVEGQGPALLGHADLGDQLVGLGVDSDACRPWPGRPSRGPPGSCRWRRGPWPRPGAARRGCRAGLRRPPGHSAARAATRCRRTGAAGRPVHSWRSCRPGHSWRSRRPGRRGPGRRSVVAPILCTAGSEAGAAGAAASGIAGCDCGLGLSQGEAGARGVGHHRRDGRGGRGLQPRVGPRHLDIVQDVLGPIRVQGRDTRPSSGPGGPSCRPRRGGRPSGAGGTSGPAPHRAPGRPARAAGRLRTFSRRRSARAAAATFSGLSSKRL